MHFKNLKALNGFKPSIYSNEAATFITKVLFFNNKSGEQSGRLKKIKNKILLNIHNFIILKN